MVKYYGKVTPLSKLARCSHRATVRVAGKITYTWASKPQKRPVAYDTCL